MRELSRQIRGVVGYPDINPNQWLPLLTKMGGRDFTPTDPIYMKCLKIVTNGRARRASVLRETLRQLAS